MFGAEHSTNPAVLDVLIQANGDVNARDKVRGYGSVDLLSCWNVCVRGCRSDFDCVSAIATNEGEGKSERVRVRGLVRE